MPLLSDKIHSFFIIVLIALSIVSPLAVQGNESNLYNQEFELTGNILLIGEGQYNINGILSIEAFELDLENRYNVTFDASLPDYQEKGSSIFMENQETKLLSVDQSIKNNRVLDFLWETYSQNGENDVYSIFRISILELNMGQFKLFNYTVTSYTEDKFYTPHLKYSINAYKIELDLDNGSFTLYYDIDNLVLIGFRSIFVSDELGNNGIKIEITGIISSTTLELPRGDPPAWAPYLQGFVLFLVILPVIVYSYRYFFRKEIIIKGGLEN